MSRFQNPSGEKFCTRSSTSGETSLSKKRKTSQHKQIAPHLGSTINGWEQQIFDIFRVFCMWTEFTKSYSSEKCQVGLSITYFKNYHIKHAVQSQDVDAHYGIFTTNTSKKIHIIIFISRYPSSTLGFVFMILNMYNNHQSGKIFMKIQDVYSSFQCISSNRSWHIMAFTEQGVILKPLKLISNFQKCSVRISWSWNG